jgi:N-acetylated-alpha-linked acidic dipeptidase
MIIDSLILTLLDLNVDEATNGGPSLLPVSSPLLTQALFDAAQAVPSPLEDGMQIDKDWVFILDGLNDKGHDTVYSDWLQQTKIENPSSNTPRIDTIGTGSDFTIFQHHLGIPSTDLVFSGGQKNAVFQYHSKYDSFLWMEKFGDPGFRKHKAMAELWGLLTLRLASQAVLLFLARPYAESLKKGFSGLRFSSNIGRKELNQAIERFSEEAVRLDQEAEDIRRHLEVNKDHDDSLAIYNINERYRSMEKSFLNEEGLPQRRWYKHMVRHIHSIHMMNMSRNKELT